MGNRFIRARGTLAAGLLASGMALLGTGCSDKTAATAPSSPAVVAQQSVAPTPAETASPEATASATPEAEYGTITVTYDQPKKKKFKKIAKALKESGAYEELAEQLTDTYKLPTDLKIRFTELGEENAYWDPNTDEITVGYELLDTYSKIFEIDKKDPKAYQREIIDAGYFTVFHEIGHALVALLDIPVTGSEEDAVDEFATITLLNQHDEQSENALIAGIEQFSLDAQSEEATEVSQLSFSDEHSFNKQRFYDVLSLVYGSDPEAHADLLSEDYLPEEMAEDSQAEYERKTAVWDKLMAPHLREPAAASAD